MTRFTSSQAARAASKRRVQPGIRSRDRCGGSDHSCRRSLLHAGAAVINGKIFIVGGFVANVHVGAVNRVFDARPGDRSLARPGAARRSARLSGVVALNGKIHAIGGRDPERNTVASHEIYDPSNNSWTMAAPLPLARDHLGAVVGGRIHVFGGRTNATVDNTARHDVRPRHQQLEFSGAAAHRRSAGVAFSWLAGLFMREANARIRRVASRSPRSRRTTREPTGGRPCHRCSRVGTLPALRSSDNRHISSGATWAAVATGRRRTC